MKAESEGMDSPRMSRAGRIDGNVYTYVIYVRAARGNTLKGMGAQLEHVTGRESTILEVALLSVWKEP